MTEREQIVRYMRVMGASRPPKEMLARHPEWTNEVLYLAAAMFLATADQIERGVHTRTEGANDE